jgi:hypothetical protein
MHTPESLFERLDAQRGGRALPPVHRWAPERQGSSHMRIAADGRWFHAGREIRRPEMVRLFSTILRRDADAFVLVTPAERLTIEVDDAPFVAIDFETRETPQWREIAFVTNVGDVVVADAEHALRLEPCNASRVPYVHVRAGLDARLSRAAYYRLADLVEREGDRDGVRSRGVFFPLT